MQILLSVYLPFYQEKLVKAAAKVLAMVYPNVCSVRNCLKVHSRKHEWEKDTKKCTAMHDKAEYIRSRNDLTPP